MPQGSISFRPWQALVCLSARSWKFPMFDTRFLALLSHCLATNTFNSHVLVDLDYFYLLFSFTYNARVMSAPVNIRVKNKGFLGFRP